jgi:hypothetical protein
LRLGVAPFDRHAFASALGQPLGDKQLALNVAQAFGAVPGMRAL